ncbi:unnamed protein product, partial [Rotaria sp. Silwood2]
MSQSSTNSITYAASSSRSNSISSIKYNTNTFLLFNTYTSEYIGSSIKTNTDTVVSTSSTAFTNQTSSHTDTTISFTPLNSIPYSSLITSNTISVTLTSINMNTIPNSTLSYPTEFSSNNDNQSISSINSGASITKTIINVPTSSQLISTISTSSSQTSTIPISLNSIFSSTVVSNISSSFASIMSIESHSALPLISTQSNQMTMMPISQQNVTTQITLSTQSSVISTAMITSASNLSTTITTANQTVNSTSSTTTISTSQRTTVAASYRISIIIIVPFNQNFTPSDNNTIQSIRQGLIRVINFAFNCLSNSPYPNCTQSKLRVKRQICSSGYDVNLVSDITQISNDTSRKYTVDYSVIDLCRSGVLLSPIQVKTATDVLSREQIISALGYDYDGALIRSTTIDSKQTPETDRKLWLIGAILGPIAFVLLLIFVFCYLHYKCRPRPTNRALAKPVYNAPPTSARST